MSVPMGGGYYQTSPQVSFDWLGRGWDLFKARAGVWVGAILAYLVVVGLVFAVVGVPTGYWASLQEVMRARSTGIPPTPVNPVAQFGGNLVLQVVVGAISYLLLGGLYRMAIRQVRGENIAVGDLFSAFDTAGPLIVLGIITQLLASLGFLCCVIPGFVVMGLFMFAPLFVVDRRLNPFQAITESINLLKSQWLMASLFYFVAALVGGLGALLCGVGMLATYPMFLISIAVGYLAFTQTVQVAPSFNAPTPGVWPPPPASSQMQNPFGTPPPPADPPRTSLSGEPLDQGQSQSQSQNPPGPEPPRV